MSTHLFGQSQEVADSIPGNQADGGSDSPNSQRIRESAFRVADIALHSTRWIEALIMGVNDNIGALSDKDLDSLVQTALRVVDALPATELDEIAQKAGL